MLSYILDYILYKRLIGPMQLTRQRKFNWGSVNLKLITLVGYLIG